MSRVKCPWCEEWFKTDEVENTYDKKLKRYFHDNCYKAYERELHHKEELKKYILNMFNYKGLGPKINSQIKKYRTELNFTYEGILKSLKYFYDIKGNSIEKANGGIGIVPYVYQEANNYYNKKELKTKSIEKRINKFKISEENKKKIVVKRSDLIKDKKEKNTIDIDEI